VRASRYWTRKSEARTTTDEDRKSGARGDERRSRQRGDLVSDDMLATQPLNLVDLARASYPRFECRHCGVAVDKRDSRWLDRAGLEDCVGGRLHWGIEVRSVSPSPLLRRFG